MPVHPDLVEYSDKYGLPAEDNLSLRPIIAQAIRIAHAGQEFLVSYNSSKDVLIVARQEAYETPRPGLHTLVAFKLGNGLLPQSEFDIQINDKKEAKVLKARNIRTPGNGMKEVVMRSLVAHAPAHFKVEDVVNKGAEIIIETAKGFARYGEFYGALFAALNENILPNKTLGKKFERALEAIITRVGADFLPAEMTSLRKSSGPSPA